MYGVALPFGLLMLIAGLMIDPAGLHLWGLITYTGIMLILLPIVGWPVLLQAAIFPPAGESRLGSVLATWIGGTLVGVSVIFWIASVSGYPPAGARIDPFGHMLIPFAPRAGIAIGLFALSMLVASGVVGTIAPILRREIAIQCAAVGGIVLFAVVYAIGCVLVVG
jgi:hypothetical protein